MSFDVNWDINSHREEHESDEHWTLRRDFMVRWKNDYPEERLVCLARVFANIELLGCRYPLEVMQEVSRLSYDVAQAYRKSRKNKLQRTFVSASDAAEDRAKGVRREGGIIVDTPPSKSMKISFVPQGHTPNPETVEIEDPPSDDEIKNEQNEKTEEIKTSEVTDPNDYLNDLLKVKCLDIRTFGDHMFETEFGRLVLLVRPWTTKLSNLQASCQVCGIALSNTYENNCFSLFMNGGLVAQATGANKPEAKSIVEVMVWNRLKEEVISVVVKQQWIAHGDARISVSDVAGKQQEFGTPVENSVASKWVAVLHDS